MLYFQLLTIVRNSLRVADDVRSDAIARSHCVWLAYRHHPSLRCGYESSHWQVKGVGRNIRTPLIDFFRATCASTHPTQVNERPTGKVSCERRPYIDWIALPKTDVMSHTAYLTGWLASCWCDSVIHLTSVIHFHSGVPPDRLPFTGRPTDWMCVTPHRMALRYWPNRNDI